MPLIETAAGREHTRMRCDTLDQAGLRLRIARIRNPQKMYEFVCELGRRQNGGSYWRSLYNIAAAKLGMMGYDATGRENGLPVQDYTPAGSRPRLRQRAYNVLRHQEREEARRIVQTPPFIAIEPLQTHHYLGYKLVLSSATTSAPFSQLTGTDFGAFVNVLRSHNVPWHIIAMSLGTTVMKLIPMLYNIGYTKAQVNEITEQRDRTITINPVRRITLRKENQ